MKPQFCGLLTATKWNEHLAKICVGDGSSTRPSRASLGRLFSTCTKYARDQTHSSPTDLSSRARRGIQVLACTTEIAASAKARYSKRETIPALDRLVISFAGASPAQHSSITTHFAAKVNPFAADCAHKSFTLVSGKFFGRQIDFHPLAGE